MKKTNPHTHTDLQTAQDYAELIQTLTALGESVNPRGEVLQSALARIARTHIDQPVPSTYTRILSPFQNHHSFFWKVSVSTLAVVLIAGGATLTTSRLHLPVSTMPGTTPPDMSNPTDTSDAAIGQDLGVIDSEMSSLDTSVADTNQSVQEVESYMQ